jgi:hypothetical protein
MNNSHGYDMDMDYQLLDFEDKKPAKTEVKGECPKCGKHVGKGIHIHVRGCNGHPAKAR